MAVKPQIKTLTNSSVDVLNAIRNNATQEYQNYIPIATANSESIREIGNIMMDYTPLQNEFLNALVNRIGRVILTSKMYSNPLEMFKKGVLEYGETIEDIFVNLAKPFEFDPEVAESEVFKREIPDVRSAFYTMNYQKFYKSTVTNDQLRQAFLSLDGVTNLIAKIVDAMYTAANYDEFQTTKYMLARNILNGRIKVEGIGQVTDANMKNIVSTIKGVSNDLEFLKTDYNVAGVYNNSTKSEQYVLVDTKFEAKMSVEVLASAFNMDKADFIGMRVLIDGFGSVDSKRLAELFKDDPTYKPLTEEEKEVLNSVPAIIVDKDYFMIFDNFTQFTENYNGQGLYWNYFYHRWATFATSPFANACMFAAGSPSVDSVTVSPKAATVTAGQSVQLSVDVETSNFAPKTVVWSVPESAKATITQTGVLKVDKAAESAEEIVVTVKSTANGSVLDTATITVA